jgi:hypothetical protein
MITHVNSRRSLAAAAGELLVAGRWLATPAGAATGNPGVKASKNRTTFLAFARYLRSLYPLDTRIAAQFPAVRYCTLDGTDHASPEEQARMFGPLPRLS